MASFELKPTLASDAAPYLASGWYVVSLDYKPSVPEAILILRRDPSDERRPEGSE